MKSGGSMATRDDETNKRGGNGLIRLSPRMDELRRRYSSM